MMRKTTCSGGFLLCFLINLILNFEGILPAVLLLAAHILWGWPLIFAGLALIVWLLGIFLWMLVFGWASRCGSHRDNPLPNKNPYSAKTADYLHSPKNIGENDRENK